MKLDTRLAVSGAKFSLFAQPRFLPDQPETISINVPPNLIKPGPADDRTRVFSASTRAKTFLIEAFRFDHGQGQSIQSEALLLQQNHRCLEVLDEIPGSCGAEPAGHRRARAPCGQGVR